MPGSSRVRGQGSQDQGQVHRGVPGYGKGGDSDAHPLTWILLGHKLLNFNSVLSKEKEGGCK